MHLPTTNILSAYLSPLFKDVVMRQATLGGDSFFAFEIDA
jgi:hypothetical protein